MCVAYKFYIFLLRIDFLSFMFLFRGVQTINLTVTNGVPLPVAYDILTAAFQYGNNTHQTYQTISSRLFLMGIPGKEPWNLKTAPNVKLKASSG